MGKYQRMAAVLLAVCMLVCLLAGCNELHSDSYEDIMNGIIVDSLYGETYVYNCLGNELSVSIEDGKVFIQSMSEYEPQDDFDAEMAEVYMYSGTYTQENGILTANIDEMRIRYLVSGKDKVALQTALIADATLEGFKNAASFFSEKGMLLKNLYDDTNYPATATIKIDTTGETWQWISGEVYCEDSTLYECVYMADNGNALYEHYYGDGYLVDKTEYSPDGIELRCISYYEDGNERFHYEYYEDGNLKIEMSNGYINEAYDRDGNEIEYYGHNYIDGVCDFCGEAEPPYSEGLNIRERWNTDNSAPYLEGYSVTGLGTCTDTDIVIPAMYKGLPIVAIADSAFSKCSSITSVTIPGSVTTIGDSAFCDCPNLTTVTVQAVCCGGYSLLKTLGKSAFAGCPNLTGFEIPKNVESMYSSTFSFEKNIAQPAPEIDEYGDRYYNCRFYAENHCLVDDYRAELLKVFSSDDTDIVIPDGVRRISEAALSDCGSNMTSITIPDSVTHIQYQWFVERSKLTRIHVASGNEYYHSTGNCLIETESKLLIMGCGTSVIPADGSVTAIFNGAFYDCGDLTSIIIPDSVTFIDIAAFENCTNLASITIPDSVTYIGVCTFFGCSSLMDITYNGTKAEWRAIDKGHSWEDNTGNYTIHCTDGDIAKADS